MDRRLDFTRRQLFAALLLALIGGVASGQSTERASVDSSGAEGDDYSSSARLSDDGRVVAFTSVADNLVPSDANGASDVFVRDLVTGATERVSVSTAGVEGNDDSQEPAISADGRFVVFSSLADNLVAGDTNGQVDVFVHDRKHATTWRVSVDSAGLEGDRSSSRQSISGNGRFVAFESWARNLVPGDTNSSPDIFVHDNVTGVTERVSVDNFGNESNGDSWMPRISADGDRIVFVSYADNLVVGDTNKFIDVFVHDRPSGSTTRVNLAWNGAEATADSDFAEISADGTVISFGSPAPNLVPNDLNGSYDTFVVDPAHGSIERVSVDSAGVEGNANTGTSSLSSDGRYVAFASWADNLVAGDSNLDVDVFVHDRKLGITWRASVAGDGSEGDDGSQTPSLSGNGREIAFESDATNLVAGDANGVSDVFVRRVVAADWSNYGAGFAGTLGVPELTAEQVPTLGTSITVDVGNSAGIFTPGLLAIGFARADLTLSSGAKLLVDVSIWLPLQIPDLGLTLSSSLPNDELLCGLVVDVQALELDSGAVKNLSFSRGLELTLGH